MRERVFFITIVAEVVYNKFICVLECIYLSAFRFYCISLLIYRVPFIRDFGDRLFYSDIYISCVSLCHLRSSMNLIVRYK